MNRNLSQSIYDINRLCAIALSALSIWAILSVPCRADYTYGGTELSWEWLTDASRAIVVGSVTSVEDDAFVLKVAQVLKRRELAIEVGQSVQGPVLGRAQLYDRNPLHWQIGWPTLSDAATYPHNGAIYDCLWQPRFNRQNTWTQGDRCLLFYGRDLQSPLQIINLDKPVTIGVDFLASDLAGEPIARPERLLQLIQERVATTQDAQGRPRVRSAGINYWPPKRRIDSGHHYYFVLAPPEKVLATLWQSEILSPPESLITQPNYAPSGHYDLRDHPVAAQAVWYWFFSGKSTKDFSLDAQQERNAALRQLFYSEQGEQDIRRKIAHHDGTDYFRFRYFRRNRINYRTFPLGWLCVRSYEPQYAALLDGSFLQIYKVDAASERIERRVLTRRDAHRVRTYIEFSRDSRFLAYTTAENTVSLIDLEKGTLRWTASPNTPAVTSASRYGVSLCMNFSGDGRYLAQQTQLRGPAPGVEHPSMLDRTTGLHAVHVWDVQTGEVVFIPYATWQGGLHFVAFHPSNSSLIRLRRSEGAIRHDEIWNVRTGELVKTLDEKAPWDQTE